MRENDVFGGRGSHRPIDTAKRAISPLIKIPLSPNLLDKSMLFTEAATTVNELKLHLLNQESIDLRCRFWMDSIREKSLEEAFQNAVNQLKSRRK